MIMRPLKVTAVMQDGRVVGNDPWFPLDSILAAAWVKKYHPDCFYAGTPDPTSPGWIDADLPLERRGNDRLWYYACSFNTVRPSWEYITHWHKRFDEQFERYVNFGGRRGKIDVKAARFKAFRMPMTVLLFPRLEWYAVGDMDAVFDLCRSITHIGKKSSQGFGAVDSWKVEIWPEDWSEAYHGRLTRAVPVDFGLPDTVESAYLALHGYRPPYWWSGCQAVCFMPEV